MTSTSQTVVNTVNTVGVMGKGLAAAFKERFPPMFEDYKRHCNENEFKPGSSWLWKGDEQWVLNFATKKHWRNPSKLQYVHDGLDEFRQKFEQFGIREIAFPRLGCGNGGLDWDIVRPLMVEKLRDLPISVFIHDFEKPIGLPEHDLPLLQASPPKDFEVFMADLSAAIEKKIDGVTLVGHTKNKIFTQISENYDLRGVDKCDKLLASGEDIYQIWALLTKSPVSRFDLPETPYQHALKVFSVLAELPYIRLINLANLAGKPNLAIEMRREHSALPVSLSRVIPNGN
jgi:O-acetyl-ADP-ribose deacetylase (regulator of RNase III)